MKRKRMPLLTNDRIVIYMPVFVMCTIFGSFAIAAPPAVAPCSLVTKPEVEQVVGKLKGNPKAEKEGDASCCNYEFANDRDAMEVWVFPADGMQGGHKQAKKPMSVKGLGEDAFLDRGALGLDYVNLFIKKGDVTVELSLKETAGDEDKLKTLARKALRRLSFVRKPMAISDSA